jgi:hypothetical protein
MIFFVAVLRQKYLNACSSGLFCFDEDKLVFVRNYQTVFLVADSVRLGYAVSAVWSNL